MAKKPRRQTYSLEAYLKKIVNESIRSDQDVQRLSGQWDNNMINELLVTILTDDYIPPIILGEEIINDAAQLWIIEGLQRSTALSLFKYGNYKITSSVEEYRIEYQKKVTDQDGSIRRDDDGNILWETLEFDIRNKTYNDLPEELKNRFDEYQLETVIHEDCTMQKMSKLVRRYNNHKPMNTSQKAFTYVENHAREIREITNQNRFLKDCGKYTEKERNNGTLERMVMESVMCMFHLDDWQKQSKRISAFLNVNASKEEFDRLNSNMNRLKKIYSEDLKDIFTSKDSFIWFTLFDRFTKLPLEDFEFAGFLLEFKRVLYSRKLNGVSFYEIDEKHSTKDKSVVIQKLDLLESLMLEYFHMKKEDMEGTNALDFVKENVNPEATQEDIEQYEEVLEELTLNVDNSSRLLEKQNRTSLIGMVAYSFDRDIDLDRWIVDFFARSRTYLRNQKENFLFMKNDLSRFIGLETVKMV